MASVGLYYYLLHVYQSVALQYIADRPGKYKTYDAHQPLCFNLLVFLHGDVNIGHLWEESSATVTQFSLM